MSLVYVVAAWLMGLWVAQRVRIPGRYWLVAVCTLLIVSLLLRRRRALPLAVCGVALCAASLWYQFRLPRIDATHVAEFNDAGQVTLQGQIASQPEPNGSRWQATVNATSVRSGGAYATVHGSVLATLPAFPEARQGDTVVLSGRLLTPPVFEDFSYKDYLARRGVYSVLDAESVTVLSSGSEGLSGTLAALRGRAEARIAALLPEPEAALLSGILLGREAGIPDDVMDAFRVTGTAHIIAISGFNITILIGLLSAMLVRLFGKRWLVLILIPAVALYTLFVGADAAVTRAAIMGCLSLLALQFGRRSDALNALMLSALVMTLLQPQVLWDVGFQLSFAATLGLILYVEPLRTALEGAVARRFSGPWVQGLLRWLEEGLVVTVAAQILTLPLTVAYFHNISPFGLLANLLILPAQPYVMIWGGSALLLGMAWLPLGFPVGAVAWLFLTYSVRVAEFVAGLPGSSLQVAVVPAAAILVYYGVVAALTLGRSVITNRIKPGLAKLLRFFSRWRLVSAMSLVAALIWIAVPQMPDGRLHVHFLDVGEGDAIFIRTPHGRTVLIDGGSDPARLLSEIGERLPFWDRSLDLVVLTHAHADHAGGLIGVLQRYRVGVFVEAVPGSGAEYKACMAAVQARGIEHVTAVPGQSFLLDEGVKLQVLYPPAGIECASVNDCSMTLTLSKGRASFLLPGDLEQAGQIGLMQTTEVPLCQVLKVPHHGGQDALVEDFLSRAAPSIAVIEPGPAASIDPSPSTLARLESAGALVWQTGKRGSLEVITDGLRLWTKPRQ